MKYLGSASLLIFFCIQSSASWAQNKSTDMFSIPAMNISLERLPEGPDTVIPEKLFTFRPKTVAVEAFSISKQINLKEYKRFLERLRQEAGEASYQRHLPDSSIGTPEQYRQYLTDPEFEKYPVIGVSWINAMDYCKWRTMEESVSDEYQFIYRLPTRIEWMAANSHLDGNKKSDFNKDYSDLVVDDYYENAYSFLHDLNPDIRYGEAEYEGSRRKGYIGNSYFISFLHPTSFDDSWIDHSRGLPYLGFRYVRVPVMPHWRNNRNSPVYKIMRYWNLW